MGLLQHIYVTAIGSFPSGVWAGETGQMGFRAAIYDVDATPPKGSVFTMMNSGDIVATGGSTAGTNGTLAQAWTARLGAAGSTENADAAFQIGIAEDVLTFLTACKAYQSPDFKWTGVKIAPIQPDGKYGAPSSVYTFTAPVAGTGGANAFPPEVSIAMSLRAPVLGRRGRGRMYLPGLSGASWQSTGEVLPAARTALGAALKTLCDNVNNVPGFSEYLPLISVTSAGSSSAVRPSETRVGNHFDVQRRRQHQVPEVYTVTAL